jgi:hypothetical protein
MLAHLSARHLITQEEAQMAQSREHSDRRSGGGAFYLPQRLIVQLGITEEAPEGGVVQMEPGWYTHDNLDPRVLDHPIIQQLVPQDSAIAEQNQAQADMHRKIYSGEATQGDMDKLLQEQAQANNEAREKATEEWNGRAQTAADRGQVFMDLHPDPAVNFARFLTAPGPQYIAAGGMQSKIEPPVNAPAIQPATRPQVAPQGQRPAQAPPHRPD